MIHRSDVVPLPSTEAFDLFVRTTAWWPHPGTLTITPHKGGAVTLTLPDGTVLKRGTVIAWDRGTYLAFTWNEPEILETIVAVSFTPAGNGTRVALTQGTPDILGDPADAVSNVRMRLWGLTLGAFCAAARTCVAA